MADVQPHTEPAERFSNRHWLLQNKSDGKGIIGCQCGFVAADDDNGYGDSVVDHIAAVALTEFADDIDRHYPVDIFIPPTAEQIAETHALLTKDGGTVDAWSAHIMRHAAKLARSSVEV